MYIRLLVVILGCSALVVRGGTPAARYGSDKQHAQASAAHLREVYTNAPQRHTLEHHLHGVKDRESHERALASHVNDVYERSSRNPSLRDPVTLEDVENGAVYEATFHSLAEGAVVRRRPNGLLAIAKEVPLATQCHVQVAYHVGSRDEEENIHGLAHVLEHMMFQGTRARPVPAAPLMDALGMSYNAYTEFDSTVYHETMDCAALEAALQLEAERMNQLYVQDHLLQKEKRVVQSEIRGDMNNPVKMAVLDAMQSILGDVRDAKYGHHIGGSEQTVQGLNPADVRTFHNEHYFPANAAIIVTGPVPTATAHSLIQTYFDPIDNGARVPRAARHSDPIDPIPLQQKPFDITVRHNVASPLLLRFFPAPGAASLDSAYMQPALAELSGSRRSLIFQKLVKTQLATSASCSANSMALVSLITCSIHVGTNSTLDEAESAFEEVLREVGRTGTSQKMLSLMRRQSDVSHAFANHMSASVAGGLVHALTKTGSIIHADEIRKTSLKASLSDIKRFAQRLLRPSVRQRAVIMPREETGEDLLAEITDVHPTRCVDSRDDSSAAFKPFAYPQSTQYSAEWGKSAASQHEACGIARFGYTLSEADTETDLRSSSPGSNLIAAATDTSNTSLQQLHTADAPPLDIADIIQYIPESFRGVTPRTPNVPYQRVSLGSAAATLRAASRPGYGIFFLAGYVSGAGFESDPGGKEGVAALGAAMLGKGPASMDATAFADTLSWLGASISFTASRTEFAFSASALAQDAATVIALLRETLRSPALDRAEFERVRASTVLGLRGSALSAQGRLADAARDALFADDSPLRRRATAESVASIQHDDIVSFFKEIVQANVAQAVIFIDGEYDNESVLEELRKLVQSGTDTAPEGHRRARRTVLIEDALDADTKRVPPPSVHPSPTMGQQRSLWDVKADGSRNPPAPVLASIREATDDSARDPNTFRSYTCGRRIHIQDDLLHEGYISIKAPGFHQYHKHTPAAQLLMWTLASSSLVGRLAFELRDRSGLTYTVAASHAAARTHGVVTIFMQAQPENIVPSLNKTTSILEDAVNESLSQRELKFYQDSLVSKYNAALADPDDVLQTCLADLAAGREDCPSVRAAEQIANVNPQAVQHVAREILDPRSFVVLTVSPQGPEADTPLEYACANTRPDTHILTEDQALLQR